MPEGNSYNVGYGKPPREGQFTKGRSGNPKGRPKGSRNLSTIVLEESRQMVNVQGPRGVRRISKLHATVMQLQNKAAQGHLPSQRELFGLVKMSEESESSSGGSVHVPEADQQMMQSLLRRMQQLSSASAETQIQSKAGKPE